MLIGRDREMGEIVRGLEGARLVTLVGPGGVGKTTLARATADQWPARDVLFADLTALEPAGLDQGMAGSLGFGSFASLMAALADRRRLLILDNCEHVIDEAAALTDRLLDHSDELALLATSRERLDVPGELVVRIDPLSTEGWPSPAAELFMAAATARGVTLEDDPQAVAELCRRLDGLPLALELAAARSSAMTASEMIDHLASRLDLLARSRARGPSRHRSLSAAIAWSHHQLESPVRRAFEALSVFRAPFTVEMAGGLIDDARQTINVLVDRSLLVHEPVAGVSWYRMLETVKSFARERLEESGARESVEGRLLEHLTARAEEVAAARVMDDPAVPQELGRSYRNLHWAIERSMEAGDADRCHRLISPLWWLEDTGHQREAADLIGRVVTRFPERSPEAGISWGILACLTRVSEATNDCADAAQVAVESGGVGAAYGHRTLGQIDRARGRWDDALAHFELGRAFAVEAGHHGLAAEIDLHAGLTKARAGRMDESIADLEALLERTAAHPLTHAWTQDFLSYIQLTTDPEGSRALALEVLEQAEAWRNEWLIASSHLNLGAAAALNKDPLVAAHHLAACIDSYVSIRSRTDMGLAMLVAPAIFQMLDDPESAAGTIAARTRYVASEMGEFEQIFDQLVPLPEVGPHDPGYDAEEVARRLRALATRDAEANHANRFARDGDGWVIAFGGVELRQKSSKGLEDLARLLAHPGLEIAAVDLADAHVVAGGAGELSDAEARRRYEVRLRELQADIDDAAAAGDTGRAERARAEFDSIVDHLSAAYGLGGRTRGSGDPAEKARSAVTWRIRAAIKRLREVHPTLGDHLDRSVTTGRFCVYAPEPAVEWEA